MNLTVDQVKEILDRHERWMKNGSTGERAQLSGVDMHCMQVFAGRDLSFADLSFSNLCFVDLSNTKLYGTNLQFANLYGTKLRGATDIPHLPQLIVCPESGSFIGYKKGVGSTIIELLIPKTAKRLSGGTRICRCDKAKVAAIWDRWGRKINETKSSNNGEITYTVGKTIKISNFDEDRWNENSSGISFVMSRAEAQRQK